jgi:hypothetical protein
MGDKRLRIVRLNPMPGPDASSPTEIPAVTVSNPARSISVTTRNGYADKIAITPAALNATEAELAAHIVEVARFSYARDQANRADRLVAESVAAGDNENDCRRYLHRCNNLPTQNDVDAAYTAHYQANLGT